MKATDIIIHPFEGIGSSLLQPLGIALVERFGVNASLGEVQAVPARAYSSQRKQYHSTKLLEQLAAYKDNHKRTRLGVTAVDLFVPELNFVFGEASSPEQVAVFSIARLDPRFYGDPQDDSRLKQRAIKEAMHELGHVFGLGHCRRQECVMWFSNTLLETDRKRSEFCQQCAREIGLLPRTVNVHA